MERALVIVPFRGADPAALARLAAELVARGWRVEQLPAIGVPPDAPDRARGQSRAGILLRSAGRAAPGRRVLGVTDHDLYAEGLNFVFGIAELPGRAAVISTARLWAEDPATFGERVLKEAVHELGHTLGLGHCADARCVMHFSNTLADTDRKRSDYCARCRERVGAA